MQNSAAICDFPPEKRALLHEILERVADKWTLLVIEALDGERELRFSDLQRRVGSVSHKMLTKTLRQLERDGLATRRVHAAVPPRVDYSLTPLGESPASARGSASISQRSNAPGVPTMGKAIVQTCREFPKFDSYRRHPSTSS
jgi:DNA-binding HxlR family transcriptional regulator